MTENARPHFGTVHVTTADVLADHKRLLLHLTVGVVNKHELGLLIRFLQETQAKLEDVQK